VAEVKPFRALRYDPARVELDAVVAPPYDVIDDDARSGYLARSPYNVVHLTLGEPEEAGAAFRSWQEEGVLVRDEEPALWWVSQEYVGPDGVARTRDGFAAAVRVEPYSQRVVLPHERTHAGPKEGRLRLLRAARAQLEPIFLLHDASAPERPVRPPDVETEEGGVRSRLWRIAEPAEVARLAEPLRDAQLLIADGHHRYETAVAYAEEEPGATHTFAVLVSTQDPGLEIFPTHRLFARRPPGLDELGLREEAASVEEALARLLAAPAEWAAAVLYEEGRASLVEGGAGLDTALVDRLGHEGISYTASLEEARRQVDAGEAAVAVLLRPTPIDAVRELAARGETMPQKSTYFFPKLLSGLLFFPL
jgi:uncharacterized protein (DUF1015 family)